MTISDDEIFEEIHDDEPDEEYLAVLEKIKIKENFEELEYFKNLYSYFIKIVKSFFENDYADLEELNHEYIKTSAIIENIAGKLHLNPNTKGQLLDVNLLNKLYIPFSTILNAEVEFRTKRQTLSWKKVRPELLETYNEIDTLIKYISGKDTLTEEDVMASKRLLTSKQKISFYKQKEVISKIAITNISEINKNTEDNVIQKGNKRIRLPKFESTDWGKITIHFIDKENVRITAKQKSGEKIVVSNFEDLAFKNEKTGKPNLSWVLLESISKMDGILKVDKPVKNNIKKQKEILATQLKIIFNNRTDPFDFNKESHSYKLLINLISVNGLKDKIDKDNLDETWKDKMTTRKELLVEEDNW